MSISRQEYQRRSETGAAFHYLYRAASILCKNKDLTEKERIAAVESLINEFIENYGINPDGDTLELLASYILEANKSDIVTLNGRQVYWRKRKELYEGEYEEILVSQYDEYTELREKENIWTAIDNEIENAEVYEVYTYVDESLINPAPTLEEEGDYRGTPEYLAWAKAVKDRDGWTCQNPYCRSRVREVHAHHLDAYNHAIDKRTELSNGITLCKKCHLRFHYEYGFGYNTREQFYEWLDKEKKERSARYGV